MQITKVVLFPFAAMGAVANPIEFKSNSLDVRADASALVKYPGTCTQKTNECKYKVEEKGNDILVKCPSFANKKCTKDGAKCTFDSYSREVTCG